MREVADDALAATHVLQRESAASSGLILIARFRGVSVRLVARAVDAPLGRRPASLSSRCGSRGLECRSALTGQHQQPGPADEPGLRLPLVRGTRSVSVEPAPRALNLSDSERSRPSRRARTMTSPRSPRRPRGLAEAMHQSDPGSAGSHDRCPSKGIVPRPPQLLLLLGERPGHLDGLIVSSMAGIPSWASTRCVC